MKHHIQTGLTASLALVASISDALPYHHHRQSSYPGWANIETMFIFGDSYTSTGFNLSLDQPNPSNPFGNPAYPGYTSSNGPNWIDFLTTTYNSSQISTINLAYGGATIDSSLVAPYQPTVLSVVQQVQDEFLPSYTPPSNSLLSWFPRTTLFGIWIGINDINNSYSSSNSSSLLPKVFSVYASLLDQLYVSGARNFLFLNVPPVDRSPGTVAAGPTATSLEKSAIADWNARLVALSKNLTSTYHDSTTFQVDTNTLFNKVIDDPCSYAQTCAYKNTTDYCDVYANEALTSWYEFNQSCGVSVDEYFWLNTLHPTFRVHNATAAVVAEALA